MEVQCLCVTACLGGKWECRWVSGDVVSVLQGAFLQARMESFRRRGVICRETWACRMYWLIVWGGGLPYCAAIDSLVYVPPTRCVPCSLLSALARGRSPGRAGRPSARLAPRLECGVCAGPGGGYVTELLGVWRSRLARPSRGGFFCRASCHPLALCIRPLFVSQTSSAAQQGETTRHAGNLRAN